MLYLWDSFSLKEVILKVTEHGVHDDIDCKQNVEIKEEDWRNIKLSSILRFYRGGQPLLFFLISTQFVENDHYYIYGKPAFTKEEIDYCALFHIPTEDFQLSLGFALIMNFSIDFIQDFLLKYQKVEDKVFKFQRLSTIAFLTTTEINFKSKNDKN